MKTVFAMMCLALSTPALAQTGGTPATGGFGGLSGLLGSALPNVAGTGAENAAGVLGYCVKNNLLSGANATSVLGSLAGRSGVATSPGYQAGQSGLLQTGQAGASPLSLGAMRGQIKTQVCNLVLRRAKSFL